eukprot:2234379-Pyramimonas_sp.AAC.1
MSESDEKCVLDALNMSWLGAKISDDADFELIHYCLIDGRPLDCGGRREVAKTRVVAATRLVAGGPMATPL